MDIFELIDWRRRDKSTAAPDTTLPTITAKLNGGGEDVVRVAEALNEIRLARAAWTAHASELEELRKSSVAEGADSKRRKAIREALDRAAEEIELLAQGEPGMAQRLSRAQERARAEAVGRRFEAYALAYQVVRDAVLAAEGAQLALMQTREAAVRECGEHAVAGFFPHVHFAGVLGHGFAEQWARESDRAIESARRSREPLRRPAERTQAPASSAAGAAKPAGRRPRMTDSQRALGSGVIGPDAAREHQPRPENLVAKRVADDLAPLEPGQVRVIALQSGWSPRINASQTHFGQKLRMDAGEAAEHARHGFVEIIERLIDPAVLQANEGTFKPIGRIGEAHPSGEDLVRISPISPAPEPPR
jgi:hypothetical protein